MNERLSLIQLEALEHVKSKTKELNSKAKQSLNKILEKYNIEHSVIDKVLSHIQSKAQVVIHFHPDRPLKNGLSVAESLFETGHYLNQFETGLSNGGLTPFRGGQRDDWEKGLFGGVYQKTDTAITERPKYGALDLWNFSDGPAPRFGSCYFRLKSDSSNHCSFTNRDSYQEPDAFGTIDNFINILTSLLEEIDTKGKVLGGKDLNVPDFLNHLLTISNKKVNYSSNYGRTLDDYIETQIHGPVELEKDVDTLVVDPSFQSTKIGEVLKDICEKYNIELDWHGGFKIHVSNVPDEFRGSKIPLLAKRIGGDGFIKTSMLGDAVYSLINNPKIWHDWDTYDETMQHIKYLWHTMANYGESLK